MRFTNAFGVTDFSDIHKKHGVKNRKPQGHDALSFKSLNKPLRKNFVTRLGNAFYKHIWSYMYLSYVKKRLWVITRRRIKLQVVKINHC